MAASKTRRKFFIHKSRIVLLTLLLAQRAAKAAALENPGAFLVVASG